MQVVSAFFIPMSASAVTVPTDDTKELYDEVTRVTRIAALGNCMNRNEQDPGDRKITYSQAAGGEWFKSNSQIYVGYLTGKESCNGLVSAVAGYAGVSPINLMCKFNSFMHDENGAYTACAEGTPGIEAYSFWALDYAVRDGSGETPDKNRTYSVDYYEDVVLGFFKLNRDGSPSGAARYYMYLTQFLDLGTCRATQTYSNLSGWSKATLNVMGRNGLESPTTGQVTEGELEMVKRDYYFNPNTTSDLALESFIQPADRGSEKVGRYVPAYATMGLLAGGTVHRSRTVIGTEYPETKDGDTGNTLARISANTYMFGPSVAAQLGDPTPSGKSLKDFGIFGGMDLQEDTSSSKKMFMEFMDCQALANAVNDNSSSFNTWRKNKNVEAAPVAGESELDPDADASTTCNIDGVGWIVCPALNFVAEIVDTTYGAIDGLLATETELYSSEDGNATYEAWKNMRDVANVGFVIAFLIVIFSQITGLGLSNYGVKKLLPKIVIVAILINLSYFVAQIAVDLSNILGGSLKTAIEGQVTYSLGNGDSNMGSVGGITALMLGGAATAVAAGSLVYFAGIGIFIPIVLGALVAVVIVLLILVLRKALVVLLIVVAPIAFLAMLLPNTKTWYSKWQKTFVALLLVYPAIAAMFGASKLAASIVAQGPGIENAVMGVAISTLPLFLVLPMLKGSLNAIPAIGSFAQKAFNRGTGGFKSGMNERAKQGRANMGNKVRSAALGGTFGGAGRWAAGGRGRRASKSKEYAGAAARSEAGYVADKVSNNKHASIYAQADAVTTKSKLTNDELESIVTLLDAKPPETALAEAKSQLISAIQSGKPGDIVKARAANKFLSKTAFGREARDGVLAEQESYISGENYDTELSRSLRSDILSSGTKAYNNAVNTFAYGGAPDENGQPTVTSISSALERNTIKGLQDREVASQDIHVLKNAKKKGHIDAAQAQKILDNNNIDLNPEKRELFEAIAGSGANGGVEPDSINIPHGDDTTTGGPGPTFTGS